MRKRVGLNILNIGNSNPVKLINIVKIIEKILNKKANIVYEPKNNLDVFKTHSDNSRAMKLLNWHPKYNVEEGILNTINWYKKNKDTIGKLS